MICNKINALCIIISDMVMREPPTKTVHKETFPQHKSDFIYIATLYSDSPGPEMKLTVHVDRPESSDATLSPFSRVVTFVSGTFKTTWPTAWVDLGWNTHDRDLLRRTPRERDLLRGMPHNHDLLRRMPHNHDLLSRMPRNHDLLSRMS